MPLQWFMLSRFFVTCVYSYIKKTCTLVDKMESPVWLLVPHKELQDRQLSLVRISFHASFAKHPYPDTGTNQRRSFRHDDLR